MVTALMDLVVVAWTRTFYFMLEVSIFWFVELRPFALQRDLRDFDWLRS